MKNNNWYFTADLHIHHSNIIKFCKRPFFSPEEEGLFLKVQNGEIPEGDLRISRESTERMNSTIFNSINAVVKPDDTLVILGDFCFPKGSDKIAIAKNCRDQINCKNVILILGNHDNREILEPLFQGCYEQRLFNVEGQQIHVSHYPARSWDKASHGSWMLYGHVHNLYQDEDNGKLMPYEKQVLTKGFSDVLEGLKVFRDKGQIDRTVEHLLQICASLNGIDLTLDVGVDNDIRGNHIPFGTPWSMSEIRNYMEAKRVLWELRKNKYNKLKTQ